MAWAFTSLSAFLWPVLPQAPEVQADHAVRSKGRSVILVTSKFLWQPYQLPCAERFLVQRRIIALGINDNVRMINLKGIYVYNCAICKLCLNLLALIA
jgi:hypothetical protein